MALIPHLWPTILGNFVDAYGTGVAAPVFMKVKIKDLLTFKDNVVIEPMLSVPIALTGMADKAGETAKEAKMRKSSIFGERGTSTYVRKWNHLQGLWPMPPPGDSSIFSKKSHF